MIQEMKFRLSPQEGFSAEHLERYIRKQLKLSDSTNLKIDLKRRSIDGRSREVKVDLIVDVYIDENFIVKPLRGIEYRDVSSSPEAVIIGAGPAGLFAALRLIERGIKPIVIERGKDVRSRRRDLAALNKDHLVNEDSNYCFGEGGAGTYSDGKLYTRSHKRGSIAGVLDTFFAHGAVEEILIDTHPHIGTNKLPGIIVSMRETIRNFGGEVHFETKLSDISLENDGLKSVHFSNGTSVKTKAVILATGHSARDIYELLHRKNIYLEFKPFALGIRAEHPQQLIDKIQYHCESRGEYLPPASYSLVEQVNGRGVYSFCMCPGGIIAPCATAPGEVVTNGWSPSKRNNPFANSGVVVEINESDLLPYSKFGPLAGIEFQKSIEQIACKAAGGNQTVPAQRMVDFCNNKTSSQLGKSSYMPGIASINLNDILPKVVSERLKEAFPSFDRKMKGYYTNEAILHAVESRTSTPVRIPRNIETFQHDQVKGLFPCGEGAGFAGGIVSAAMDGQKVADAVAEFLKA
ncbi:MAG: FAD-binding protein [Bacteroidia bacterium]